MPPQVINFDSFSKKTNKMLDQLRSQLRKGFLKKINAKKIDSEFVPEIDNFESILEIRNFCFMSMKENGYNSG